MVDEFPTGREARRRFGWRPYVASMAVSASERRRGIGRELLRAAERTARGWGYRELMLEVAQENDVAVRLPTLLGHPARAASSLAPSPGMTLDVRYLPAARRAPSMSVTASE